MSLAAGALSKTSVGPTTASLVSAAATGGTGPYTYQWYRSTVSGFTPGGGNLIAGATALTLNDTGLIPNTQYYYEVVATDTGNGNATANSAQLAVQTSAPVLNPNQFAQSSIVGMIDMRFPYNTVAAQIDFSQATPLYAGQAVKIVDSVDGIPKIVGCPPIPTRCLDLSTTTLSPSHFLRSKLRNLDGRELHLPLRHHRDFRGTQVQLDISTVGGVAAKVGSSGADIVGYAFDKAAAPGALIRVHLIVPSFLKA